MACEGLIKLVAKHLLGYQRLSLCPETCLILTDVIYDTTAK
jgi:hypothetical protein